RCHRRQRLDALASARSKQSPAVVAQGLLPILMADNACKLLNIRLKTPFTLLRRLKIHRRHPLFDVRIVLIANSCWAFPLQGMRLCDSVRLATATSHDAFAQLLAAMDAMRSGIAMRLFQASQQASTISS